VYRFFCLQSHYRKPLLFTYEVLDNAKNSYEKLQKRVLSLQPQGEPDMEAVSRYQDAFCEAMGNDINTSQALTVLYDVLKGDISDATKRYLVEDFDKVFSLNLTEKVGESETDDEQAAFVEQKIAERNQARKDKDFAKADAIRQELLELGIELKDTREGTLWSRK
jgi:cysteinyl-tRNA synthetase